MSRRYVFIHIVVLFCLVYSCHCVSEIKTCSTSSSPQDSKCKSVSDTENDETMRESPQVATATDPGAMETLFYSTTQMEQFFEDHFEKTPMYISNSERNRPNRLRWMEYYRRFLPSGDLDKILSHNISFLNSSLPLQLHHDIDVLRVAKYNDKPKQFIWRPISIAVQLDVLRAAVRDGSLLQLYEMSYRSRFVAAFIDSLRNFWMVPTSALLSFHPPGTIHHPLPAPSISASELFIICIEGTASAFTRDDFFEFPLPYHVNSESIHSASTRNDNDNTQKNWTMHEGDVLYIPRGSSYDIRTPASSLAIFLYVHIHTEHRLIFHAIEQSIHMTRTRFDNNFINMKLDSTSHHNATWADLLMSSVRIAAEFNPAMRRFLPLGGEVRDVMDETGLGVGETLLQDALGRFSRAASTALFDPLLDVLMSSEDDGSSFPITSQEIVLWARSLKASSNQNDKSLHTAKIQYQASVEEVFKTSAAEPTVISESMIVDWSDVGQSKWKEFIDKREQFLALHGQAD